MLVNRALTLIRPLNPAIRGAAQARLDSLTKPQGSLGRLEELACRIACIQESVPPRLGRKLLFVFAADHGVAEECVSAYPKAVTAQMTRNFLEGGAAINVLARHYGVELQFVDMGVDYVFASRPVLRDLKIRRGTDNFTHGPAMTRAEALQSLEAGIALVDEAAARDLFLVGAGDMGIANTTSAAAVLCALTGFSPADITGRGTGVDDGAMAKKVAAVERGLSVNRPSPDDAIDVLAKVGGFEIGAMTGALLGAAAHRVPAMLDGYVSAAAALLAVRMHRDAAAYFIASHLSRENGHRRILEHMGLNPLLSLDMRLGEGTGACIAMGLAEAAVKIIRDMASFDSAGVAKRTS